MKLEQLRTTTAIRGIVPDALVTVVSVRWFGAEALEPTDKTASGRVANELPYRHDDPRPELVEQGRPWSLDGDGALFRVASEAKHIRLAHLFDPVQAVHTSIVEPLPYQITASTKPCCLASRCASPWRTIPAPAGRSWSAC